MTVLSEPRQPAGLGLAESARARRGWRGNPTLTLVAVALGVMMVALDGTIVAVANPSIQSHLHASLADIQWVMNGYMLALAVTLIPIGKVGDRFGHKKVFVTGMVGFALFSAGIGLSGDTAKSISLVIAFRVAQGVFGAMLMPTALALLRETFPVDKLNAALGIWAGVIGASTARLPRPTRELGVLLLRERGSRCGGPGHDTPFRPGDCTVAGSPVLRLCRHRPVVSRFVLVDLGIDEGVGLRLGQCPYNRVLRRGGGGACVVRPL